jgi:hypothetical protein
LQHRDEAERTDKEHKQAEQERNEERERQDLAERREALRKVYIRYLLAVDLLENRIRELGDARRSTISERGMNATGTTQSGDAFLERFEAAQREYDEVCEILKLAAPSKTVQVVRQQRELFNGFAPEAIHGHYDHDASKKESIAEVAEPVFAVMRLDLGIPD